MGGDKDEVKGDLYVSVVFLSLDCWGLEGQNTLNTDRKFEGGGLVLLILLTM